MALRIIAILSAIIALASDAGAAERRVALVIGNSNYVSSPLTNPANDANDVADILGRLGFRVIRKINIGLQEMEDSIRIFGSHLRQADVGLFFYAGHGMQVNGQNYLIPTDAVLSKETDVRYKAVDAGQLLDEMNAAGNRLNIVILDACRDNPFARSFRSNAQRGLAQMNAPTGTLIAYATAPGSVAADGSGRNSPFTKHFLRHIAAPCQNIESILKNVRNGVIAETGSRQIPWESSSLTGDFYFTCSNSGTFSTTPPEIPPTSQKAKLNVESDVSGAQVIINGRVVGKTPIREAELAEGQYHIRVEQRGYQAYEQRISVEKGRKVSVYAKLRGVGRIENDEPPPPIPPKPVQPPVTSATLAIFPFENNSVTDRNQYDRLGNGISQMLTTEINKMNQKYKLVDREKIDVVINEVKLNQSEYIDQATAVKIGRMLGAHYVAFGSFMVMGNEIRIDMRIIRVETSAVAFAESVSGSKDNVISLVASLAGKIT